MKSSEKQIEKVDQLFKSKLDEHSIAPAENAWAKVEAGLSKKNKLWLGNTPTAVVWRMAAAVLLVGALLSIVYWSPFGSGSEKMVAKKAPALRAPEKEAAQTEPTKRIAQPTPPEKDRQSKDKRDLAAKNDRAKEIDQPKQSTEPRKKIIGAEQQLAGQNNFKSDRLDAAQEMRGEEKIKGEATPQTEVASIKQKPIKLEFTLDPLPSEETVATTTEEKSTGIKRVLHLAREMKQGEGFGGLREKKDELLAHNFLTKKDRNQ